ncbi:hypothetical protein BC332_08891 [Capsicum chinense]|nr:hypothetical protein BC332_08891 [Capsicum chinense]
MHCKALAKRMICGKHAKVMSSIKRKKMNKLKESAWKFMYFLSAEIFVLYVTYNEPWFTKTRYFSSGPGDQVWPHLKIKMARVGSMIAVIHEGNDVLMEFAKMLINIQWVADIFFGLFALSWLLLRLIYFPFRIIWSTSYEVVFTVDKEKYQNINGIILYILIQNLMKMSTNRADRSVAKIKNMDY